MADFIPIPDPEYGHNLQLHPENLDRLYEQNHCGIYRMDRSEGRWVRVGGRMPKSIGSNIVLHPTYTDTIWVLPMDGTMVWPRTSPGRRPAAYITRNAGRTWKRQAMSRDERDPVGLYFGTTGGEVWGAATRVRRGSAWCATSRRSIQLRWSECG